MDIERTTCGASHLLGLPYEFLRAPNSYIVSRNRTYRHQGIVFQTNEMLVICMPMYHDYTIYYPGRPSQASRFRGTVVYMP